MSTATYMKMDAKGDDYSKSEVDSRMLESATVSNGTVTETQQTEDDYLDADVAHLQKMTDFKSYSKGLMDIALLSANANQLRTALEYPGPHKWFIVGMITLSLILQVLATILLVLERLTCNKKDYKRCHSYNAAIAISVVLIIVVNIIITAFGVPDIHIPPSPLPGPTGLMEAQNITINT
eukprot:TRINITY_DN23598_c0_g1_i6.p1 TRINITY_DN23598_c0_g1~~TRINITY_DN23598_c0_g1_i6.p1  ORF type:complete len:180 (-),score=34.34 TRINITY_DN23598_c0_g1_i6:185-724(-)